MTKPNDYGKFTRYQPDLPADDPRVRMGVIWLKNEAGADWYAFQKLLPSSGTYCVVEDTGRIRVSNADPSFLVPDGLRVIRLAQALPNSALEGKYINLQTGELSDPPPLVPQAISDRQFFQQLAVQGLISRQEALDAVRMGYVPPALDSIIKAIANPDARFEAEMLVSGATEFRRDHPVTRQIGAAIGWSEAEVDEFFIDAAAL